MSESGNAVAQARLDRLEKVTSTPLLMLAVVFLAAYAIPIIWHDVPEWVHSLCEAVIITTWIAFAVDYVARFSLAPDKWEFVKHNLIELASVILPLFRPLELLRLVTLMEVFDRQGARTIRGRVLFYALGATTLLIFVASLAVTDAERPTESMINGWGDGLWWAFTTMTTVGYGDMAPVSVEGRVIAAVLMICGVSLLGILTASMSSWFVQRIAEENAPDQPPLAEEMETLYNEVKTLRQQINPGAPD